MPSTIHQINMIAVSILLLFLSITPLVHGQEIFSTVEGVQEEDSNEVSAGARYTTITGRSNNNVAGGLHNAASDSIRRKLDNDDSGDLAFIGLGTNNVATGAKTVVGGGSGNIANATHASILGGLGNVASESYVTIGGGYDNTASGEDSTLSGGGGNVASGKVATVGGGYYNVASGEKSTVSGGGENVASGFASTVGGGYDNTASGYMSFVGGGYENTANGKYSIAMGNNAKAETDQSCVINLLTEKVASSTKVGEFLVSSKSFHVSSSKSFTIRIGSKKVTINKKNINNFKNLLKGPSRRLKQNDEQKEIIKKLQQQNNKQQEQIDELHRMLINFVGRSTE